MKKRSSHPWFNKELKRLVRTKTKFYKKAKTSGNWTEYKENQKICKRAFQTAENNFVNNTINKGLEEKNSKPFWRYIKSKKSDNIGVSPLKDKGKLVSESKKKAEILLNQFKSVFTMDKKKDMPDMKKRVGDTVNDIKIDENGVEKLLAPGISALFQKSLETGELPKDWTDANITPVFKKGDKHAAENYRAVSLTSVLSKVLDHIVCHHLHAHFEKNNILTDVNHGFRKGFSCETQLTITVDDLARNSDEGSQTDVAILDFSKAFNTVPHSSRLME